MTIRTRRNHKIKNSKRNKSKNRNIYKIHFRAVGKTEMIKNRSSLDAPMIKIRVCSLKIHKLHPKPISRGKYNL